MAIASSLTRSIAAGLLAAVSIFTSGAASARDLRMSSGLPPATAQTMGVQHFADRVRELSKGEIKIKVFPGNLLNIAETMGGIKDGVVDAGFTVPAYHRAEFPQVNLVIDLATVGDDAIALTGAASEYLFQCSECLKEVLAQNQVMLGIGALPTYQLMSREKIADVADFKGKKIRSFSSFGRWVESLGGTMVSLGANDIYEAMGQRQIDGNLHPPEQLKSTSFADHMRYLLDLGTGSYIGNSYVNINRKVWNELTDAQKKLMLQAAADSIAVATVEFTKRNQDVLGNLKALKVELVKPTPALVKATEEFRAGEVKTAVRINSEKYGIKDADERAQRFIALSAKWKERVKSVNTKDPKAVAKLYWDEVYSKVDLATLK